MGALRVIIATQRPPFPLDNGSRIRTQRLATGLARELEVVLVTYGDGPTYDDTSATPAELEAALPGVEIELVPYRGSDPPGVRRGALRRSSVTWGHFDTPALRAALQRLVTPGSILQLENPGAGLAGLAVRADVRRVFAPHNVEERIVRELAAAAGPAHKPFLAIEAWRVGREERRLWRACDLTLAVSETDAAAIRGGGARRVEVCPNGADARTPAPWSPPRPSEPLRLLFVGTGDYPPYEHGLRWFVREALPRLRADGPVALDVVGARPRAPETAPDVIYHGRVPEVEPFYERAHALVIPVFQGSGTRLKAVEAAMAGRPVVSTALGAEGLPLRPGVEYLRAEDADGYAVAAARLRAGDVAGLVAAARAAAEPLRWDAIARALAERYRTMTR